MYTGDVTRIRCLLPGNASGLAYPHCSLVLSTRQPVLRPKSAGYSPTTAELLFPCLCAHHAALLSTWTALLSHLPLTFPTYTCSSSDRPSSSQSKVIEARAQGECLWPRAQGLAGASQGAAVHTADLGVTLVCGSTPGCP